MERNKFERLVTMGLMTALVFIGTVLIPIELPIKGFIHIGDSMVYLSAIFLGPIWGAVAAAVGSAIADLILGFVQYAPATFIIKGMDAMVVGFIYHRMKGKEDGAIRKAISFAVAVTVGATIMVSGYFSYEYYLYGFEDAYVNIPANITQALWGGVLAYILLIPFEKLPMGMKYSNNKDRFK